MAVSRFRNREYVEQLETSLEYFEERIAELEFAREDVGWMRLGSDSSYEFTKAYLNSIVARSRLYFLQNPLINRAVSLQADYVFAQSVNIQGVSPVINQVVQDFLDDVQNQRELTSHQAHLLKEQTLLIDGNVFFVLFTDKIRTGKVQLRSILVEEITEIITNPDDSNEIWFYKREWISREESNNSPTQNVVYYPDIDYMPIKKGALKLPSTRNKIKILWDAPILHIKTGMLAKSRYGIPETYSALDWAKAHTKMLTDWATIVAMFARYALKITTAGDKQSVVATKNRLQTSRTSGNLSETNPPTATGGVFIRQKDGTDIEPLKTSGATTSAEDSRQLRLMIASAMGLPDPMLSGEVDVGNLATAKTLDRPTELKFRSRQQLWQDVLGKILKWVIRWSIEAQDGPLRNKIKVTFDDFGNVIYKPGYDKKTKRPIDMQVEVRFPPILERTIQERIDAVTTAVTLNGKSFAVDSPELKKLTIRLMLQALGLSDVDEIVEQIFATLSDDDLKDDSDGNNGRSDTGNTEPEDDDGDTEPPRRDPDSESVDVLL